jgi:hypothetical protein
MKSFAPRRSFGCLIALGCLLIPASVSAQADPNLPVAQPDPALAPAPAKPEAASIDPAEAARVEAAKAEEAAEAAKAAAAAKAAEEAARAVEWKAQSKGGLVLTSGNSQTTNATFGVNASRKQGNNKLALEGGIAYGKSKNQVAVVDTTTTPGTITGIDRREVVSTNMWSAKGRYDRFLTDNNAAYASGQGAADKVAGKSFFGGGQVGYSRQLLKSPMHTLVAELGYDFSYERYVQPAGSTLAPVTVQSARVFVGETLTLTPETGLTASVEALLNVNKENKAVNVSDGSTGVDAFKDTRVNGKLGITSNLWKKLSLGLSVTVKYDQNPALRPVPAGTAAGAAFPKPFPSYAFADKVDTLTEATLIYTFF